PPSAPAPADGGPSGLTPSQPQAPTPPQVAAARAQVGVTPRYDPTYPVLAYPGGDFPVDRGVCTDVVVR
ncbi:DUF1287 domain-containing protein, partial [Stenotrophomonas maltophilia]|uniref:DUF1287 domain-containing protein n=1 Tax=Stenotrophomonas maltophilia TaxID=40324 RepID=UPI0031454F7A